MPKTYKKDIQKNRFLELYRQNHGIILTACKKLKMSRQTFYEWYENDKDFAREVDYVKEDAIDYTKSKLFENISKGKEASIFFHLKCVAGFCEKQQIEINTKLIAFEPIGKYGQKYKQT